MLDTEKNEQLVLRRASRDAAKCLTLLSATTPHLLLFSHFRFFFPLLPSFSSPSFILPKWAPTELNTAQLMATVVAGRAYLAATSHAMKDLKKDTGGELASGALAVLHFEKAANQSLARYSCSALLGSIEASSLVRARLIRTLISPPADSPPLLCTSQ